MEYIRTDVEGFQEEWLMCRREEQEKSIREDKRRLEKAKKRLSDIDTLITRIYEDMVLGNLSQERYQKMLEGYEAELTPTIVNEFIKQIIVYAPEKVNGKRTQKDGVTLGHAALCGK